MSSLLLTCLSVPLPWTPLSRATVNRRWPTKGLLSWVSGTHSARGADPHILKTPAFLYQNVKIQELLLEQWSPSPDINPVLSSLRSSKHLWLILAPAGNSQAGVGKGVGIPAHAHPSKGGGKESWTTPVSSLTTSAGSCSRSTLPDDKFRFLISQDQNRPG